MSESTRESLFDIVAQFRADLAKIEGLDLDPDTVRDTIESMSGKLEDKLRAVIGYATELESDAASRKAQADRMAKGAKAMSNRADWLFTYAQIALKASKLPLPLRLPEFTLNLAKMPPAVDITDEAKLPEPFVRTTVTFELTQGLTSQQIVSSGDGADATMFYVFRVPVEHAEIERVPRRADILTSLKAGVAVEGAGLAPDAQRLTVR